MTDQIKATIEKSLPGAVAYVLDPHNDNTHFESIVVSEQFEGMPLVKQHQLVMNALKEEFASTVHALALKTFTPTRWESEKTKYNFDK